MLNRVSNWVKEPQYLGLQLQQGSDICFFLSHTTPFW